ncbi:MAG: hypothetical protein VYD70_03010 [Planctomycetota bacterium]|nr:hypothetical protein [Planctomycetota bacterium]
MVQVSVSSVAPRPLQTVEREKMYTIDDYAFIAVAALDRELNATRC